MTAALLLLLYALLGCTLGRRILTHASWTEVSPRLGILAWQALTVSVALAWCLAAVVLALCTLPIGGVLASISGLTPDEVMRHYEPPVGDWLGVVAVLLAIGAIGIVAVRFVRGLLQATRSRHRQLELLTLLGTAHPDGYTVVETDERLVYCVPGRDKTIVVSTGALKLLTEQEIDFVLRHEELHLRARHDLAVAFADAVAGAFPGLRLFEHARDRIEVLVEMQADDAAHDTADRHALARALTALATGYQSSIPSEGIETAAGRRVRRLSGGPKSIPSVQRVTIALGLGGLLALPIGLAVAPALEAASTECCQVAVSTR